MRLPRMTVRRMMVYVGIFEVVPNVAIRFVPSIETARQHWATCRQQAVHSNQLASLYRYFATRYPPDAIIPGVTVRRMEKGPAIAANGRAAAKMAPYFAARARIYERAKWRPWVGFPPDPPWPVW
jgi:hypothetical protein